MKWRAIGTAALAVVTLSGGPHLPIGSSCRIALGPAGSSSPRYDASAALAEATAGQAERHRFDLGRLRPLQDETTVSSGRRLRTLLAYLREEMTSPSYPSLGIGGGPIDSGYVKEVIVGVMGATIDPRDLARVLKVEKDPQTRVCLTVALAAAGDTSVVPEVTRIMLHHPDGFLRHEAALALADLRDPSTKEALRKALADRYTRVRFASIGRDSADKLYPVREAAAGGLLAMGEETPEGVVADVRKPAPFPEAVSWLFEDKQPGVCLSAVQVLDDYGEEGIPYLKTFVEQNETDETLKEALDLAKALIEAQESPPAEPA